jgi:hypothetical protein
VNDLLPQPGGFEGFGPSEKDLTSCDLAIREPEDAPRTKLCLHTAARATGGHKGPEEDLSIAHVGDLCSPILQGTRPQTTSDSRWQVIWPFSTVFTNVLRSLGRTTEDA